MNIAIWIGLTFVISAIATGFTRASAVGTGCLLPVAATLLAIIYIMFIVAPVASNSTAPVFIPFAFIWTALGSVPGAFAGLSVRRLRSRAD